MSAKKLPETCPDIDQFIHNAEQELAGLLRQEASILGNIERLKAQLSDTQRGIAANQQSIGTARDAITAYRQFLIDEDEKAAKAQAKE